MIPLFALSRELMRLSKFKKAMEIMMKIPFDPALYSSHKLKMIFRMPKIPKSKVKRRCCLMESNVKVYRNPYYSCILDAIASIRLDKIKCDGSCTSKEWKEKNFNSQEIINALTLLIFPKPQQPIS